MTASTARQTFREAVAQIAQKAKEKLPECNGRVAKAVKLVLAGDVAVLDEARAAAPRYPGSGDSGPGLPTHVRGTPAAEGWIWHGRSLLHLAPDVYDLRCSLAYWASKPGLHRQHWSAQGCLSNPLEATFSRAVRSLVKRGLLQRLGVVPVDAVDPLFCREQDVTELREEDGSTRFYMVLGSDKQTRFVKLMC